MPSDGSVTRWLRELQAGDPAAVQRLWERPFRRLVGGLAGLGDPEPESVAPGRREGYTVEQIACRRGCVARSIKRKLRLIRGIWEKEVGA